MFGLVAGLSGMLAGHIWNRYSQQTSELGFRADFTWVELVFPGMV